MTEPPSKIGRFQIRSELGQGAFGTVYRAFDPQFGREVALKVPHLDIRTWYQNTFPEVVNRPLLLRNPRCACHKQT